MITRLSGEFFPVTEFESNSIHHFSVYNKTKFMKNSLLLSELQSVVEWSWLLSLNLRIHLVADAQM